MIAVFLSPLYLLLNGYLLWRSLKWLGVCFPLFRVRAVMVMLTILYTMVALSMVTAFFLPGGAVKRVLKQVSNYWLGVMLYLSIAVLTADLIRILTMMFADQNWRMAEHLLLHRAAGVLCTLFVALVSLYGLYAARKIEVSHHEVTIDKDGGELSGLRIVLAADLHIGYNIGCSDIERLVNRINEQNPDLTVIAGDLFDNEYEALDDPEQLAKLLHGIESRYGTYAVYGNHDIEEPILAGFTFGYGEKKVSHPLMDALVKKAGIRLLRDEGVLIEDSFWLYGRPDAKRPGRGIEKRKTPEEFVEGMDLSRPLIVLDHQPGELEELEAAGVDLDLCGHTHDGQLFPLSLITGWKWKNASGYLKVGRMHNIVTSGSGIFGPYMRVGTRAEISVIDVKFEKK
ncbi:MAG: metallophosphoesterase [Eubacteriales bacterium]|nr:metallophosphoesterase [Eubacteriales bacterium]